MAVDDNVNLVNNAMSDDAAAILAALKQGNFFLSLHAAGRMRQRSVTAADIRACGRTARSCLYQIQSRTWRIDGLDLDGEELAVICAIGDPVVIVTIF